MCGNDERREKKEKMKRKKQWLLWPQQNSISGIHHHRKMAMTR
jgi:hypothetical protein